MNIANHPELLDRLAASYALGTLRGGARRRFEAMARQSATVRTSALLWQTRMHAMTELPAAQTPSINVWKRIENSLAGQSEAVRVDAARANEETARLAAQNQSILQQALAQLRASLGRWRGAALGSAFAGLLAVGVVVQTNRNLDAQADQLSAQVGQLTAQVQNSQKLRYVAVLSDDQAAASVLVTLDTDKNRLTVQRVGGYQEAGDKSLQLWALPAGGKPQSLGVMTRDKVVRLAASAQQVRAVPTLAISLEPQGGVPSATGPTGPVLFKGALLETML